MFVEAYHWLEKLEKVLLTSTSNMLFSSQSEAKPKPTWLNLRMFPSAWHQLHFFPRFASVSRLPRLVPVARFRVLGTGCKFFFALCTSFTFTALGTGGTFSRAWHRLDVFPRFAPVLRFLRLMLLACFHGLIAGCMLSRAWHQLYVVTEF